MSKKKKDTKTTTLKRKIKIEKVVVKDFREIYKLYAK